MSSHSRKTHLPPDYEPVWTYRGYELDARDFTTAMVHFFRAEVTRANVWRQRLDTTTNWAVITTAALVTFAFGSATPESHAIILLNMLLLTIFLFTEARRYRYYELWSLRVRLMETDFFASMLVPPFHPAHDWAESVAETLLHPSFPISRWEALGRRLRNNYLWLYLLLLAVWALKVWLHPAVADSWTAFFEQAAIGTLDGRYIFTAVLVYIGLILLLAILTYELRQATGEVLPRFGPDQPSMKGLRQPWFRRTRRRRQFLTLIVTNHPDEVAHLILTDLQRGVTRLHGTGMYTGQPNAVLMCAATVTEIPHLKSLVRQADPDGFVIITPAHEILGRGFQPIQE